ncbi:hypothetical protein CYMTET_23184 [Cymbomonas tetramitiformis]|uniref:Uncharacterized protein n=1 Tax=Cymbomonas tetramitiformis TaxID=36881 RepID=A0AAE0FZ00_9CHLO|nr:hypothetical protein CYMTET_23184 [Cymbomonas tetramitiformis]
MRGALLEGSGVRVERGPLLGGSGASCVKLSALHPSLRYRAVVCSRAESCAAAEYEELSRRRGVLGAKQFLEWMAETFRDEKAAALLKEGPERNPNLKSNPNRKPPRPASAGSPGPTPRELDSACGPSNTVSSGGPFLSGRELLKPRSGQQVHWPLPFRIDHMFRRWVPVSPGAPGGGETATLQETMHGVAAALEEPKAFSRGQAAGWAVAVREDAAVRAELQRRMCQPKHQLWRERPQFTPTTPSTKRSTQRTPSSARGARPPLSASGAATHRPMSSRGLGTNTELDAPPTAPLSEPGGGGAMTDRSEVRKKRNSTIYLEMRRRNLVEEFQCATTTTTDSAPTNAAEAQTVGPAHRRAATEEAGAGFGQPAGGSPVVPPLDLARLGAPGEDGKKASDGTRDVWAPRIARTLMNVRPTSRGGAGQGSPSPRPPSKAKPAKPQSARGKSGGGSVGGGSLQLEKESKPSGGRAQSARKSVEFAPAKKSALPDAARHGKRPMKPPEELKPALEGLALRHKPQPKERPPPTEEASLESLVGEGWSALVEDLAAADLVEERNQQPVRSARSGAHSARGGAKGSAMADESTLERHVQPCLCRWCEKARASDEVVTTVQLEPRRHRNNVNFVEHSVSVKRGQVSPRPPFHLPHSQIFLNYADVPMIPSPPPAHDPPRPCP